MTAVSMLNSADLRPNDYNPNSMTDVEFAELVAEVRHLGRLPKPVIARRDCDGLVIVDGEHGWRAACEVGLDVIPVEIIEADDFEAMRQTYKRNQHGTHDPVRLGQMFRAMLDQRELSVRALAKEIEVCDGTIRNALAYADAAALRNSYAFSKLSIRQVRAYLQLPAPIRDWWVDAEADLKAFKAALEPVTREDGKPRKWELSPEDFALVIEAGTHIALDPGPDHNWTPSGYVEAAHRAFALAMWINRFQNRIQAAKELALVVAELSAPVGCLDEVPVSRTDEHSPMKSKLPIEDWRQILQTVMERTGGKGNWRNTLKAAIRLKLRERGDDLDYTHPAVLLLLEQLKDAPEFIRESNLSLNEQAFLVNQSNVDEREIVDVAQREAISELRARDGWLSGNAARYLSAAGVDVTVTESWIAEARASYSKMTAESAFAEALQHERAKRRAEIIAARLQQPRDLISALLENFEDVSAVAEAVKARHDDLQRRLAAIPTDELRLLANLVFFGPAKAVEEWIAGVAS